MKEYRFNHDAETVELASEYMYIRSKQFLKYFYRFERLETYDWGISAFFSKKGKFFQSIYLLKQFRGRGLYSKNVKETILTTAECGIEEYLKNNKIPYQMEKAVPFREYEMISEFYKDRKAVRSDVYLMNHIDEGLFVLEKIGASDTAKRAYVLHPLVQNDDSLPENYETVFTENVSDTKTIIAMMEYRSVANEYLSKRKISSIEEIRLSPLKDVNDMLIADKIQNRKDFEIFHKGKHERSAELEDYFSNWLKRLNISEEFYKECYDFLHQEPVIHSK
ncbi:MAG TPA: hypothetical protein PL048_03515 [Leptospiraceae bacterium]|nr:hypothetical protein [Leptospiraceae bacterium]HMY65179.1 hypothetical protein [Leptospiraceae bacterium]HMZ57817.1 hypothetical protein [Leptospiraceae bacterium]HNH06924.1 hypothetical protein [Leptospiraceae bacterium]HNI25786.1 hypothetical protein [Leptospiraceae bacterium]